VRRFVASQTASDARAFFLPSHLLKSAPPPTDVTGGRWHVDKQSLLVLADRRTELWNRNISVGLTEAEIAEYRRLHRQLYDGIRRFYPESWERIKKLRRRRIHFRRLEG